MSAISCTCGRCEACARWNKPRPSAREADLMIADLVLHGLKSAMSSLEGHALVLEGLSMPDVAASTRGFVRQLQRIVDMAEGKSAANDEGGDAPRAA